MVTVTTDTSGNRVETNEYTDADGYKVTDTTTYYGEIPYGTLLSKSAVFIGLWTLLWLLVGLGLYFIFSLMGKIGLVIYLIWSLVAIGLNIYKAVTLDRNNFVKYTKKEKDGASSISLSGGNLSVNIYASTVSIASNIITSTILTIITLVKLFSAPAYTGPYSGGGKRKRNHNK